MVELFNCGLELTTVFFCIFIFFFYNLRTNQYESSKAFQLTILIEIVLLLCDIFECCTVLFHMDPTLTRISLTFDYVFAYLFAILFHRYLMKLIEEKNGHKFSFVVYYAGIILLVCVYFLLNLNIYNEMMFTVDQNNLVVYSNLMIIPNVVYMLIAIFDVYCILKYRQGFTRRDIIIILLYPCMLLCALPIDAIYDTSFTYVVVGLILVLTILNRALEQEEQLGETLLNTLHLQMRPHFIYNTLASISGLCYLDAEKAAEYIGIFSKYLRKSFGDMTSKSMISFEEELEHLKLYLTIEQLRFADIEVDMDFQVTDFELPCLTIQPLVENAIKHGICGRESGGTLKISSYETEEEYIIKVEDDGVGFTEVPKDGRKHIGMENVKRRLEIHKCGWLTIESTPGVGTIATVHIRK